MMTMKDVCIVVGRVMETLIKEGDYIEFLIDCDPDKDYRLSFEVFKVISWDSEYNPIDKEIFIRGSIKWDGCSDLFFGEEDCYLHSCGYGGIQDIKKVLDAIWDKAEKEIVNFN